MSGNPAATTSADAWTTIMAKRRHSVRCACGWRGRRVWRECWCYEACSHTGFGYCPQCGAEVVRPLTREERESCYHLARENG